MKVAATLFVLFLGAFTTTTVAQECKDDETKLNSMIDNILLVAPSVPSLKDNPLIGTLSAMKQQRGNKGFTCAEVKQFLQLGGKTCTESVDANFNFKLESYCCQTCRGADPTTTTAAPTTTTTPKITTAAPITTTTVETTTAAAPTTTAAPTASDKTTAATTAAQTVSVKTTAATTTASTASVKTTAATTTASTASVKTTAATTTTAALICKDNELSLNAMINTVISVAPKDNELVQQLSTLKNLRGDKGFSCSEAKLFLGFAGKTCTDKLYEQLPMKLETYCCQTCREEPETAFDQCSVVKDTKSTCEERAACDTGYVGFITAIADQVATLPFTPTQIYCFVEQQLGEQENSPSVSWKSVADIFTTDGADHCIAAMGPYAKAVKTLIGQLPASLPTTAWSGLGQLMGDACSAMQKHDKTFDTLLEAFPDNEDDYNHMITAVAGIIESFYKKNPSAQAQQVLDYLVDDYGWGEVVAHLDDYAPAQTDSQEDKQAKALASAFNVAARKTNDFTSLYQLALQVVISVFAADDVSAALVKAKNNEILGYADTKACVKSALGAVTQYCSETSSMFATAQNNAAAKPKVQTAADSATAASATFIATALGLTLVL